MRWTTRLHTLVTAAMLAAIAALVVAIGPAMAHEGHAHTDTGLDTTAVLQVAGTAVALGIVYLLASRIYRHRDALRGSDGDDGSAESSR